MWVGDCVGGWVDALVCVYVCVCVCVHVCLFLCVFVCTLTHYSTRYGCPCSEFFSWFRHPGCGQFWVICDLNQSTIFWKENANTQKYLRFQKNNWSENANKESTCVFWSHFDSSNSQMPFAMFSTLDKTNTHSLSHTHSYTHTPPHHFHLGALHSLGRENGFQLSSLSSQETCLWKMNFSNELPFFPSQFHTCVRTHYTFTTNFCKKWHHLEIYSTKALDNGSGFSVLIY